MQDANKNRLYVHEVFVADNIKKGNTLQTAASQPHGGIALYKGILSDVISATNVVNNSENPNGSERYRSNSENSSDSGLPSLDEITEAAESLAGTLGEKVRFVRDVDEIQEENPNILRRKRQSKGWYNSKT